MKKTWILSIMMGMGGMSFAQDAQAPQKDVLSNNFQLEGIVRVAGAFYRNEYYAEQQSYSSSDELGYIGIQVSNKFYFHRKDNFASGLAVHWMRAEFGADIRDFGEPAVLFSPLHLGWANSWKRKEKQAVELNLNGGFCLAPFGGGSRLGFEISPEVKLRGQHAVVGFGYVYSRFENNRYPGYRYLNQMHGFRLTVGITK